MGQRKKNFEFEQVARAKAKVKRDKNKIKRAAKPKTAGQKLHEKMSGRA